MKPLMAGLFIMAALSSRADAQLLAGRTVEDSTRRAIPSVQVTVFDGDGNEIRRVVTDSLGRFGGMLPRAGSYTLRTSHIGFVAYVSPPVEVKAGESVTVELRLGTRAVPVQPLVVSGRASAQDRLSGYRYRLRTATGTFVTRDQIDRRPGANVSDLLRNSPEIQLRPMARGPNSTPVQMITMRGGEDLCDPAMFLDGVRIMQDVNTPIDHLLNAGVLEGVEIYRNSASAPIEYQLAGGGACGTVLFWTRARDTGGAGWSWKRIAIGIGAFAGILFYTVTM